MSDVLKTLAGTPLRLTVAPERFRPLMVTAVPGVPEVGDKLVMKCLVTTVNMLVVAVPPGVVTTMGPLPASFGTAVEIWGSIEEGKWITSNWAGNPLNVTDHASDKLLPLMSTGVPPIPHRGETLEITGGGIMGTPFTEVSVVPG